MAFPEHPAPIDPAAIFPFRHFPLCSRGPLWFEHASSPGYTSSACLAIFCNACSTARESSASNSWSALPSGR